MGRAWIEATGRLTTLAALLGACSGNPPTDPRAAADANDTGGTLAGRDEGERAVLRELPALASGSPRLVGQATVIADAPYTAASGRTCRRVHVSKARQQASRRLACSRGNVWFFVPDVFGANRAD